MGGGKEMSQICMDVYLEKMSKRGREDDGQTYLKDATEFLNPKY
jgi:hypothetical protein